MEGLEFEIKCNVLEAEYESRVGGEFERCVFVGVRGATQYLTSTVALVSGLNGYDAHRFIHCGTKAVHMYVRFDSGDSASDAARLIKSEHASTLVCEVVSTLLRTWYAFEGLGGFSPATWTLCVVDVCGHAKHTDPLLQDTLHRVLSRFGSPRIVPYDRSHRQSQVEVYYPSMAEALGASIANGCWLRKMQPINRKIFYRVRLVGSEKEEILLRNCGSFVDAFQLEYFFNDKFSASPESEPLSTIVNVRDNPWRNPRCRDASKRDSRSSNSRHGPVLTRLRRQTQDWASGQSSGGVLNPSTGHAPDPYLICS